MKRIFPFVILLCVISYVYPSIGSAQSEQQGIAILNQARKLLEKTSSREDQENALKKYEEALRIFEMAGSDLGQLHALNGMGTIYFYMNQYAQSVEYNERLLVITRKMGDVKQEGRVLGGIGMAYKALGQYQKALEYYEKSLAIMQKIGDVELEGTMLNNVGFAYNMLGQHAQALEYYERSLAITRKRGDVKLEGNTLSNIGAVYSSWGQYAKALEYYEKSMAISQKTGDTKEEGLLLGDIGVAYKAFGQNEKALEYFEKVLATVDKTGDVELEGATLNNIGLTYDLLGQYAKALEYYDRELAVTRKTGDIHGEGATLSNIGQVYRNLGQYAKALDCFEKSLAIMKKTGDVKVEAVTLSSIGLVYNAWGQYAKALEYEEKSLAIRQEVGDVNGEGASLNNIGLVYQTLGRHDKALEYLEKSLVIRLKTGDVKGEGSTQNNIGLVYNALGQYQKALECFETSLAIRQKIGDVQGEGVTLNNIGAVYNAWGQYGKALEFYDKALAIKQKIGDINGEGVTLSNMGAVYNAWGQYDKALRHFEKSLAINGEIGDVHGQGVTLSNIGTVYNAWGQYANALDYYDKSLAIRRQIGDIDGEGSSLNHIGLIYQSLGQYTKALENYEKSLTIAEKIGNVSQEADSQNNIGAIYVALGQYAKGLEHYKKSLTISDKIGNLSFQGATLSNIGQVYISLGQYAKALEYFEKSLSTNRKIGVPCETTEDEIGNVYLAIGDIERAEILLKRTPNLPVCLGRLALVKADFNEAKDKFEIVLEKSAQNRDFAAMFTGHTGLGLAYEGLNQFDKAAEHFKEAITLTEQIRDTLTPGQRANFYGAQIMHVPRMTPYEGLARVLLKSGKPKESFKEAEGTKARIFAESLSGRSQDIVPDVPKKIFKQDSDINNKVTAISQGLQKAYEKGSKDAIESFERQLKDARSEKDRHVDILRKDYPLYAATKYPQPMNLEQSALKNDEWILEYEVTEPGVCIYLTHGKHIIKATFKPIARQELDGLVRKFLTPMQLRPGDPLPKKLAAFDFTSGKKLSEILLGDILSDLPKDTPLIIVPDDSLGVIPFEMLTLNQTGKITTDGKMPQTAGADFFGDLNPISYYQSITALTLARTLGKRKQIGEKTFAMVDPVFNADDPRLLKYAKQQQQELTSSLPTDLLMSIESANSITFPRVKLTAQLGESLKNADPARTDLYEGMDAKKSVILEKDLTPYRSVVFATHGYFGKDLPGIQEPVLVLTLLDQPEGQDGFLRMSEVMGLNINCDLAALTACQTGLGKQISGEGTMGMGRAFQYAGARSVLMSLWSVHEVASMNLIKSFFRIMKEGKNKSDALAAARSEIRKNGFDHPFFWAGFILVGEPQ